MTSQPERIPALDGVRGLAINQPERIPALDGVRGLAITLVVMMHSMYFAMPVPGGPNPLGLPYVHYASLGWCGVDVFFVLSGFLITGILVRSKGADHYFRNFYMRRSLRIFPLYYAVVVLLLFVFDRPETTAGEKLPYFFYVQNFTMGSEAHGDVARGITWSLAVEEQFYLVWPAVVFFVARRWLLPTCVLLIVAAIATRFVLVAQQSAEVYYLTPCRLDALVVGAVMAIVPLPSLWVGRALTVLGLTGLVLISHEVGSIPHVPMFQSWGLIAAMAFAVGALVMARHPGWFQTVCKNRVLQSIGRYSYCIYLVHFLVIGEVFWILHGPLGEAPTATHQWIAANVPATLILIGVTAIYLAATWLVAFCSWHVFEKWFLKLKDHFPSAG